MSDKIALSDMIRKPAQTPCQTPQNQAVRPLLAHPEAAPEAAVRARRGVGKHRATLEPRPLPSTPGFGEDLQSATPQALGLSGPKRRSSADPGNDAEASDRAGSESELAGAPSSAPPEFAGAAAAGTSAKLGHIASFSRAAQPGGRMTPRPRKPSGTKSPRQAPPPGRLGWRRGRPRPGRRRRAIRPEAQSSRRRPGRRWPKAGRRGARDPGSRRGPPCPAPVRRTPQRPPCGARGDRQGLRPLRPGR